MKNGMNIYKLIVFALVLALVSACGTSTSATEEAGGDEEHDMEDMEEEEHTGPVHWGYEGMEGPEYWGELSEDFALCGTGTSQSPIDVTGAVEENIDDIVFNYEVVTLDILNNGHTIQANYAEGSSIEIGGKVYNLLQFHFHGPSEHAIDGELADMEMHLVHQSADGEYAVVGVMMYAGDENAAYAPVWDNLPAEADAHMEVADVTINAADLLPADRLAYRYSGSFTTPPCTEGVVWNLLVNPVELSTGQIEAFGAIIHNNNRPVQALNDRTLTVDTGSD